jgi:hypothetical protein
MVAALEAATGMAATLDAELTGLFVEDINLLRLAGLPFAGELELVSGLWRRWALGDLERALRVHAAEAERLLAQAAERAKVQWSFQLARGQVLREALAATGEADLVVFGHSSPAYWLAPAVAVGKRVPTGVASLLLAFDATPAAFRALTTAGQLARQAAARLHLVIPAEDAVRFGRLRDEALAWLAERGLEARYLGLSRFDAAGLAEAARTRASTLLLLPADSPAADISGLALLLSQIRCPLILAR